MRVSSSLSGASHVESDTKPCPKSFAATLCYYIAIYPEETRHYMRDMRLTMADIIWSSMLHNRKIMKRRIYDMIIMGMTKMRPRQGSSLYPDVHLVCLRNLRDVATTMNVLYEMRAQQLALGRHLEIVYLGPKRPIPYSDDTCWELMRAYFHHLATVEPVWKCKSILTASPGDGSKDDVKEDFDQVGIIRHASMALICNLDEQKVELPLINENALANIYILCVWEDEKARWCVPGGAVDRSKDTCPLDTALRETQEEINPTARLTWKAISNNESSSEFVRIDIRNYKNLNRPCHAFFVGVLSSEIKADILRSESADYRMEIPLPAKYATVRSPIEELQEVHRGERKFIECSACSLIALRDIKRRKAPEPTPYDGALLQIARVVKASFLSSSATEDKVVQMKKTRLCKAMHGP